MPNDPRVTACLFCFNNQGIVVPAVKVAPQFSGGDEDRPATWVLVCDAHVADWWYEVDEDKQLPIFDLTLT